MKIVNSSFLLTQTSCSCFKIAEIGKRKKNKTVQTCNSVNNKKNKLHQMKLSLNYPIRKRKSITCAAVCDTWASTVIPKEPGTGLDFGAITAMECLECFLIRSKDLYESVLNCISEQS